MLTHQTAAGHIPGLRKITAGLRQAEDYARQWVGLPDGASKAGLLRLLEDVPASRMGLSTRERDFVHRLVKMQPAECFKSAAALKGCDLEAAALALVSTYTDTDLSAELDVTGRTLARWREAATAAGWISFRDSADRSRFRIGSADAPSEAYGIDLRPLIVRYAELERLRDQAKAQRVEFGAVQRTLSRRRTRLRSLEALTCAEGPLPYVETALRAVDAVRRGKDLDNAKMALAVINDAITQLEGLLDADAVGFFGVTQKSAAPVKTGAQLPPTTPIQDSIQIPSGREALRERESGSAVVSPVAQDEASDAAEDDEDEEIVWQSASLDDDAEVGPVIDITPPARPRYVPRGRLARVNTPNVGDVIQALPALLARKDFPFTRHPSFPTDRSLLVAYGQSAARRIGLTSEEVRKHSAGENDVAFAVAALLSEFTEGVNNRRAYLLALVGRINDPVIPVDLWASWQRVNRGASPAPGYGKRSRF
ncbi:hypothetical protein HTK96_13930 [Brevundimonas vesicularis]|uniref:helix-turn-helix domain-containing protein n=1 Tax=Brevundimonas vesicularis TaxID=41276 RepID=UPI001571D34E|nr:helix-turn-helix domain-containing protein [Brevundimonas vesicularis]NSX34473.1 hypothetical protein [Brevundimonas vesicularis]